MLARIGQMRQIGQTRHQANTGIERAAFPGSPDEAIARYDDFTNAVNESFDTERRANGALTRGQYDATTAIAFTPYLGEFDHGNIESALGVMTAELLKRIRSLIPEDEEEDALRSLKDQLVIAEGKSSMRTANASVSEEQFRAIDPILEKTYGNRQEANIAMAKAALTAIESRNPVVQALAGNVSFIRFALYFALGAVKTDNVNGVDIDTPLDISPIDWVNTRRGRILPLTMLTRNETTFPAPVLVGSVSYSSSSLFPFSMALALFIGAATFNTPEDRTGSLEAMVAEQRHEIDSLMEQPEVAEAVRRDIVSGQLEGTVPLCWFWGIFEGACNSRVPPPAGFLESIENFGDDGYMGSAQHGYDPDAIIRNPLTDIIRNAQLDTNPRITAFMGQYNEHTGIPAWRAMMLGVVDGSIVMADFRAIDGLNAAFAAAPNGFITDSDGDIVARRTLRITLPFKLNSDGTHSEAVFKLDEDGNRVEGSGVPLFRAQRGALCIIAALGRALNCLGGFEVQGETGATVDDSEQDTLRLMREILGLSMVSPEMTGPLVYGDQGRIEGFRYVLSLPVLVDDSFGDRLEAFIDGLLPDIMDIDGECAVDDIDPGQIGLSFAPTYTTCVGRNLVPELTRIIASILAGGNPLAGTEDGRGDIEQRLINMLEINEGQAGEVQTALEETVLKDRVFINAGAAFSAAASAADLRELAQAIFVRISMQQAVSTPQVRPPVQPFAPLFYMPANEIREVDDRQSINNENPLFRDEAIVIGP